MQFEADFLLFLPQTVNEKIIKIQADISMVKKKKIISRTWFAWISLAKKKGGERELNPGIVPEAALAYPIY